MTLPRASDDARYAVCFSGGADSMLVLDRAVCVGLCVGWLLMLYDEAGVCRMMSSPLPVSPAARLWWPG